VAHFDVALNLPHAATVARRITRRLEARGATSGTLTSDAFALSEDLVDLLVPFEGRETEPSPEEAAPVVNRAAEIGRSLVDEVERLGLGEDRLGQAVRNLFECLGRGEEGAEISLRAGEDPRSLLRPE
jgi:hypothetical protein